MLTGIFCFLTLEKVFGENEDGNCDKKDKVNKEKVWVDKGGGGGW